MNIIQSANAADGSAIDRIMASLDAFNTVDQDCVKELWADYAANLTGSYHFCVCRESESGEILGFACYGKHALTASTYDLYWIAVDPTSHRSGVGSDLLRYVEEQIRAENGERLIIETSSTEPYSSARRFYRHHDYEREAIIRDFYAPGDHLIIYTKYLHPPVRHPKDPAWASEVAAESDLDLHLGERKFY